MPEETLETNALLAALADDREGIQKAFEQLNAEELRGLRVACTWLHGLCGKERDRQERAAREEGEGDAG
jgi:AMMECR1 domain-containing protein